MTKGQLGLNLSAIAVLIFALTFFTGVEVLVLLAAYAILVEKDSWLVKQSLQAIFLKLTFLAVCMVLGWIFDFFSWVFKYANAVDTIENFFNFLVGIALLLFCILAITRVIRGQDANLPILGKLADFTMDAAAKVKPAAPKAPAAPVAPVVPAAPAAAAWQQPVYTAPAPVAPAPPPAPETPVVPEVPAVPAEEAAAPAAPDTWTCECGRENFGKFCMGCGKPRPN